MKDVICSACGAPCSGRFCGACGVQVQSQDVSYVPAPRGKVNFSKAFPAFQKCLNKYAVFSGRASLGEYWWFFLVSFFLMLLVEMFAHQLFSLATISEDAVYYSDEILDLFLSAAFLMPGMAVLVRRLHDVGKSGWNYCWCLTGIGSFYVMYLILQPSQATANTYGEPDPI